MGYARKWVPPTIPLRNSLPAWKEICNDIHASFILAGLVQTSDTGQLDINAVSTLPADGTFAGYRMYRFNDSHQAAAPIFIKLEFGCGLEGLGTNASDKRSRTLRISVTIGSETDGTGAIENGTSFQCPQEFSNFNSNVTSQLTQNGWSAICYNEERGFFGIAYGVGSRNDPLAGGTGGYYGTSLCFFIQRTQTNLGVPTLDGYMIYYPNLTNNSTSSWSNNSQQLSLGRYYSFVDEAFSSANSQFNTRLDNNLHPYLAGKPNFMPIFVLSDTKLNSFMGIAQYMEFALGPQTEVLIETLPNTSSNYICLGNRTSLSVAPGLNQQSAIAMLFE